MAPPVVLLVAAGQTLAVYVFLILLLGRAGRPQMAQLTLTNYVIIALLGSAVESALYAGSNSLAAGLTSATTLLLADRGLRWLISRSRLTRRLLIGSPLVLVHNGQIIASHLRRSGLSREELMAAIRMHGYDGLDDVRFAVFEVDGSIGVVGNQ
ncbi:MAG TPA: YetF domain-containing protein [Thermomicrobiaceae bacterium]|nr:YetF domain-containing protein [Thermomicrobiaceae bacterium]